MHLLEIKNLNYSVDGNTILKNINLSVNSGDFLTIVGPSGVGKSTLLKIIASLLHLHLVQLNMMEKILVNILRLNIVGKFPIVSSNRLFLEKQ